MPMGDILNRALNDEAIREKVLEDEGLREKFFGALSRTIMLQCEAMEMVRDCLMSDNAVKAYVTATEMNNAVIEALNKRMEELCAQAVEMVDREREMTPADPFNGVATPDPLD